MALSGPDAAAASSTADRAGRRTSTDHSASRALELAPQPNAVTPSQPKFGLDVFKDARPKRLLSEADPQKRCRWE